MRTSEKFMGGNIQFVYPAIDKVMPDGTKRSWEKSVKIVQGKKEIKVGKSFFEKIANLLEDRDVQQFIEDLE